MKDREPSRIELALGMEGGHAYGLGVGAVGSKLEGNRAEHAQLGSDLLHSAETSLFLCVSELYHQAG